MAYVAAGYPIKKNSIKIIVSDKKKLEKVNQTRKNCSYKTIVKIRYLYPYMHVWVNYIDG